MIDLSKIDELAGRFGDVLPPGARELRSDLEARFRTVLLKGFEKLDLVTREEFDIQKAVLERTAVKLAALEARLAELEPGESGA